MIYVIAYASFDYEYSDFVFEAYKTKEEAEEKIKELLNGRENMNGKKIFTKHNVHVIDGKEIEFTSEVRITEKVEIK